jgi:hypothetical protein
MSHKSTAPGIPYRVKPRFKRSPWAFILTLDLVCWLWFRLCMFGLAEFPPL